MRFPPLTQEAVENCDRSADIVEETLGALDEHETNDLESGECSDYRERMARGTVRSPFLGFFRRQGTANHLHCWMSNT
jgi:hypothetical protein